MADQTPFNSPSTLGGESFSHGLTRLGAEQFDSNDSDEDFVPSNDLALFIDEEGTVNVDGQIYSYEDVDPIDSEIVPKFNKENNFIKGLAAVLPTVPVGGVIGYALGSPLTSLDSLSKSIPAGYGPCNGSVYKSAETGKLWLTPYIDTLSLNFIYIQKLPEGYEATGRRIALINPLFSLSSLSS